jgi:iron complex outermembrane recepter protein
MCVEPGNKHNISQVPNMLKPQILSSLVLLAPFAITGAQAQEGDQPSGNKETFALEEIVVTANRREQSLQEVAMSVSAFTGDFFEDSGVRDLAGLDQYTPSLKITQGTSSSSTSIRIRGIGSVGTNVGIDPSVGMFIDGVYQGRAGMSVADLLDIERVEVLRGPQGTLYGKNTAAGAISIITRRPSMEVEAEGEVTYNSDERLELRGMTNIPLGDSGHATRLTGYLIDGDHLYDNTFNGDKLNDASKWGFKSRTLFDGGDGAGEFLLTLDYSKEDTDCCAVGVINYDGFSSINVPGTPDLQTALYEAAGISTDQINSLEESSGMSPPNPDPFGDDYWIDGDTFNKIEVGGIALEWNKDIFEDHTLTFINAWRHYESDSAYDGDFTAWDAVSGLQLTELDQYSSEFRITSPGGETFDYQAGIYGYYSELDSYGTFGQSQQLVENLGFVPIYLLQDPPVELTNGTLNVDDNLYKTTSYAAFGQVVWNISEELSATLGLRYTYEKKERDGSQISIPTAPIDVPPVAGPNQFYDEDRDDDDISPSLNVRYFFTPDIMGYASVSRGFKSGGFNQRRELEGVSAEFDEEIATSYELGWKTNSEDRRLQFNGTLYYVDYEDFQSQVFNGTVLTVTNAGSMESYGSEMELVFVPTSDLMISSALGYNKAEYQEFDNAQCTIQQIMTSWIAAGAPPPFPSILPCNQDLEGEAIENAPEWTLSTVAQYDMQLTEDLIGVARLEHSYVDSYYLDQDLDENLKNDAVDLVNLRFTLTNEEGSWEAAIWGKNLLDEEYYAFGIDIPVLGGYAGVAAPGAVYGLTLRLRH